MADGRWPRRLVLAAAAVGLVARLAFGLGYWVDEPLNRDEVEYLSLARSLAKGDGFVYDEHVLQGPVEPFGRAPGYPAFLALTGGGAAVFDRVPASVKIAQAVVGAIGVVAIGIAAFRLGGGRSAAAAAVLAAIHPPLVWIAGYAYSEAVFWPIGLGLALAVSGLLERRAEGLWKPAVAVGMLTGIAVLIRAATMPFVGLTGLWLLWKRRPAALAGLVLGLALVFGPWTVRNVVHHGRFVFIASDGGVTFWTGNNALATGEGDMAANPQLKFANQALRARYPTLNEEQMEPVYYREAFAWIGAHPLDWS
jgi:4-amino-4-deoxy-L-arabinose transferase-like glycosyltransferase